MKRKIPTYDSDKLCFYPSLKINPIKPQEILSFDCLVFQVDLTLVQTSPISKEGKQILEHYSSPTTKINFH